jgi:hypothetical protein
LSCQNAANRYFGAKQAMYRRYMEQTDNLNILQIKPLITPDEE